MASAAVRSTATILFLLHHCLLMLIVSEGFVFGTCFAKQYLVSFLVFSRRANIFLKKREMDALLLLSPLCLLTVNVLGFFLTVLLVGLQ